MGQAAAPEPGVGHAFAEAAFLKEFFFEVLELAITSAGRVSKKVP